MRVRFKVNNKKHIYDAIGLILLASAVSGVIAVASPLMGVTAWLAIAGCIIHNAIDKHHHAVELSKLSESIANMTPAQLDQLAKDVATS